MNAVKSLRRGFTLIELLVVMAILATLLTIAVPRYFGSLERSKEASLKMSLHVMREAIDKFYADRGRYPGGLNELVDKRYLRALPVDPFTDSTETWRVLPAPPGSEVQGNVADVKSGAEGKATDGTELAAW